MKNTMVSRNGIEQDFLCPKGVLVLVPVRHNGLQSANV